MKGVSSRLRSGRCFSGLRGISLLQATPQRAKKWTLKLQWKLTTCRPSSTTAIGSVPALAAHDAPPEKLAYDLKTILGRATERVFEKLVPTGGLLLGGAKGTNVAIGGSALGALDTFSTVKIADAVVDATAGGGRVQAALVEAVFTEEMHRWQVQCGPAGGASTRLEHCWAAPECVQFVAFGLGFGSVGFCEAAVLEVFLLSTNKTMNEVEEMGRRSKEIEVNETNRTNVRWRSLFFPAQ